MKSKAYTQINFHERLAQQKHNVKFSDIPNELLSIIFSFIAIEDLRYLVFVCKSWALMQSDIKEIWTQKVLHTFIPDLLKVIPRKSNENYYDYYRRLLPVSKHLYVELMDQHSKNYFDFYVPLTPSSKALSKMSADPRIKKIKRLSWKKHPQHLLNQIELYAKRIAKDSSNKPGGFFLFETGFEAGTDRLNISLINEARNGNTWKVLNLLAKGANKNFKDSFGYTPLHYAISSDEHVALQKLLLTAGVDTELKNNEGLTPLHYAVKFACKKWTLKRLLSAGANIHTRDNNGRTLLHTMVEEEHAAFDIITFQTVLALGIDVQTRDHNNNTAFVAAKTAKYATWLFAAGVNISDVDKEKLKHRYNEDFLTNPEAYRAYSIAYLIHAYEHSQEELITLLKNTNPAPEAVSPLHHLAFPIQIINKLSTPEKETVTKWYHRIAASIKPNRRLGKPKEILIKNPKIFDQQPIECISHDEDLLLSSISAIPIPNASIVGQITESLIPGEQHVQLPSFFSTHLPTANYQGRDIQFAPYQPAPISPSNAPNLFAEHPINFSTIDAETVSNEPQQEPEMSDRSSNFTAEEIDEMFNSFDYFPTYNSDTSNHPSSSDDEHSADEGSASQLSGF